MAGRPCPLCARPSPARFLERQGFDVPARSGCGFRYLDPYVERPWATGYARATVRRILEETDFRIASKRYVSLVMSRRYLLDRIGRLAGLPFHRRQPDAWLQRSTKVKSSHDLLVIVRGSK